MKIRTDFVTNSSSSSFIVEIEFLLTSGQKITFHGQSEEAGLIDYFNNYAVVTVSPKELGTASNVTELIDLLTRGVLDDCGDGNMVEIFAESNPQTSPWTKKTHDAYNFVETIKKNIRTMEDIRTVSISGREMNGNQTYQEKYSFDRISGKYTGNYWGDSIGGEDWEGSSHGGELRFSLEDPDLCWIKDDTPWEEFNLDDFEWGRLWWGGLQLKKYHGNAKFLSIPDGVDWLEHGVLAENCTLLKVKLPRQINPYSPVPSFCGCKNLVSVILPENKGYVNPGNFKDCENLESIVMSQAVAEIGPGPFQNCPKLKLTVPRTLKCVGISAFLGRNEITEAIFDAPVRYLRTKAFMDCANLKTVRFEKGIADFGPDVFKNCTALQEVYIAGESCKKMSKNIFAGCPNVVIHALSGTLVEEYAKEYNIPFVSIGQAAPKQITDTYESGNAQAFSGLSFAVGGSLKTFTSTDALKRLIKVHGGKFMNRVSAKTNYVISNVFWTFTLAGCEAHKYGIPIITEEEFLEMVPKQTESVTVNPQKPLEGLTFVVTGDLKNFPESGPYPARAGLKKLIEEHGGKLVGSVSGKTSYLICNDASSGTTKVREAKMRSIPIITEDEFMKMLDSTGDADVNKCSEGSEGTFTVSKPKSLEGLTFVAIGDFVHFPVRTELKKLVEAQGGKLVGSVSGKTNYLIWNKNGIHTTEVREAIARDIPIITEAEFMKMIDSAK